MNFENMTDEEWADCRRRVEEGWLALTARRNIEEWVNGLNEARQQVERLASENARLKEALEASRPLIDALEIFMEREAKSGPLLREVRRRVDDFVLVAGTVLTDLDHAGG
jgi:cell shape-determining protein MreC